MNGKEIRPIKVRSERNFTILSIRNGGRQDFKIGDEMEGFVNEHGNVYTQDEAYVGTLGHVFTEITETTELTT